MPSTPDDPEQPTLDLPALLGTLNRYGVEYLVVGGVAANGYGARRLTRDAVFYAANEQTWIAWLLPCVSSALGCASKG